jgi:hypothetical protein
VQVFEKKEKQIELKESEKQYIESREVKPIEDYCLI